MKILIYIMIFYNVFITSLYFPSENELICLSNYAMNDSTQGKASKGRALKEANRFQDVLTVFA